ncbi:unnamed protein product [Rhizophagus irregularis]|nr:unnamed protein product [Rhizophagus irregularis]
MTVNSLQADVFKESQEVPELLDCYVEALEKRINILEEKVKNLEEDNVKLLAKRNDAISDLNDKVARIRALEMDQELNARIRLGRKKKNSDY